MTNIDTNILFQEASNLILLINKIKQGGVGALSIHSNKKFSENVIKMFKFFIDNMFFNMSQDSWYRYKCTNCDLLSDLFHYLYVTDIMEGILQVNPATFVYRLCSSIE